MTQPAEDPNPLDKIQALTKDVQSQSARLRAIQRAGKLTPEVLASEVVETVLPLMEDTLGALYEAQYLQQQFGDEVAEKLWPEDGEGDEGGLWPEDAQLFKTLLGEYRDLLSAGLSTLSADDQPVATQKIEILTKALSRIDELTLEPGDDDEAEETDD